MAKVGDAYIEVKPDLDNFATSMRAQVTPLLRDQGDTDGKAYGERVSLGFANSMKTGIGSAVGKLGAQFAGIAVFAGPAAAAVSGLSAATVALAAGLVQASGASAAAVPVMGSLGQAFAAVKIGTLGVSDAFKETAKVNAKLAAGLEPTEAELANMDAAMKSLAPSARQFVQATQGLGSAWGKVRQNVQQKLFAGLGAEVKALGATYLPILNRSLGTTASVVNGVAVSFSGWLRQTSTVDRFKTALSGNNRILETLGQAVKPFANALLTLYVAVLPYGEKLAASIRNFAEWFNRAVQAGQKSGALGQWFANAWNAASSLMRTLGHLGRAIGNVFSAGESSGRGMLYYIEQLAAKFEKWTASVSGQNTLKRWFAEGQQVFNELIGLVGDLGTAFGDLAGTSDPSDTIAQMRGLVGPITKIVQQLNASGAGTGLLNTLIEFGNTLAAMNVGGTTAAFIQTLNLILTPIAKLVQVTPGATSVLGGLFAAWGGAKAINASVGFVQSFATSVTGVYDSLATVGGGLRNFHKDVQLAGGYSKATKGSIDGMKRGLSTMGGKASTALTGLTTGFKNLGTAIASGTTSMLGWVRAQSAAALAATKAKLQIIGQTVAEKARQVATKLSAAAQWLLNAAMSANPLTLIIIAIVAVVAAMVLMYKKVGWFRAGVQAAWKGILIATRAVWNVVKVVVKVAITIITTYIKVWVKTIKAVIKVGMAVVKTIMRTDWKAVVNVVKSIAKNIVTAVKSVFSRVVSTIRGAGGRLRSAAVAAFRNFVSGVNTTAKEIVTKVGEALTSAKNKITGTSFYEIGKSLMQGFVNGVGSMASTLVNKVKSVVDGAKRKAKSILGIGSPSKVFMEYGVYTGQGLAIGIAKMAGPVQAATDSLMPSPTGGIGALGGGAFGGLPGTDQTPQVRVYIGDKEITEIVRVEVRRGNQRTASSLARGRRAV